MFQKEESVAKNKGFWNEEVAVERRKGSRKKKGKILAAEELSEVGEDPEDGRETWR